MVLREDYENSKAFNVNPSLYDQRLNPQMPPDEMPLGEDESDR